MDFEPNPLADADAEPLAQGARLPGPVAFLLVVATLALFCAGCVATLAAMRAYSEAESQYAKGQKNAVIHLHRYLESGREDDYAAASRALAIPLGNRAAHLALDAPDRDPDRVRADLIQAGSDPADVRGMVAMNRVLRHAGWTGGAMRTWREADAAIAELASLGEAIHAAVHAGRPGEAERRGWIDRLDALNDRLDRLEVDFSNQLGAGARWMQGALVLATLVLAIVLAVTRLLVLKVMSDRLRRSREWLVERNARWALAAKSANLGLLDWRPDSGTTLLDERARRMFGIVSANAGALPSDLVRACIMPEDREAVRRAAVAAVAAASDLRSTSLRLRVRHGDGQVRHLELSARAFEPRADRPGHMVGLLRDVTTDVEAETARLEEAASERTYDMKNRFISQVSHELRTPLNAVLGFSQLMRDDRADPLTASQSLRLARVIEGGQYLLRLVNDLLDRASLEQGQLGVSMETVVLDDVLEGAMRLLEPARAARGLSIDVEPPPPGLCVHADPVRLKQVFVNLLSNAIKYNRPTGRITVRCAVQAAGDGGAMACVSVADEGAGIGEHRRQELFTPFRRLGAEATVPEGAGLGLVISRHLVERQGGTLALESRAGVGTTVTVSVRIDDGEHVSAVVARNEVPPPDADTRSGVVLYIEDDPVNVLLMEEYMRPLTRVRLVVANDGESGLAAAGTQHPDLVVLDMQLPDMSGLAVLGRLKKDASTCRLPVVALSASAMADDTAQALDLGVDDYWTKPISCEKLRAGVAKYLH